MMYTRAVIGWYKLNLRCFFFRAKRTKIKVVQPSSKPGSRIFSLNTNDHPRVTSKSFFRVKRPKKVELKEFEGDLGRTEIVGEMRVKMAGRFFSCTFLVIIRLEFDWRNVSFIWTLPDQLIKIALWLPVKYLSTVLSCIKNFLRIYPLDTSMRHNLWCIPR